MNRNLNTTRANSLHTGEVAVNLPETVPQSNHFRETLTVSLPDIAERPNTAPPCYEQVINDKRTNEEQPPDYMEAIRNINNR